MRWLLLLLVAHAPAFAEPVVHNRDRWVTSYEVDDGAHVVVLVDIDHPSRRKSYQQNPIFTVMNEEVEGTGKKRRLPSAVTPVGHRLYWVRLRHVNGRLICEKFSFRPRPEDIRRKIDALFAASCT